MNKLFIIGNGFDRAHGLPTSYETFLKYYLLNFAKECISKKNHTDNLLSYSARRNNIDFEEKDYSSLINLNNHFEIIQELNRFEHFTFSFGSSELFSTLTLDSENFGWIDVENSFFSCLNKIAEQHSTQNIKLRSATDITNTIINQKTTLKYLYTEFESLRKSLFRYLDQEVNQKYNFKLNEGILNILKTDYYENRHNVNGNNNFTFVDFNYTKTSISYFKDIEKKYSVRGRFFDIHGSITSGLESIVFGYGDDVNPKYDFIKEENNDDFFEYFKTFMYLKNDKYIELLNSLESHDNLKTDIYILGHSCGASDLTLLKEIFNHESVRKINIIYHKDYENFKEIAMRISRVIGNNSVLRTKIVPFNLSKKMPQTQLTLKDDKVSDTKLVKQKQQV